MKRLILLIALVVLLVILAGSSGSAVPDTTALLTDTNISDNAITASQTEESNPSASATIVITMITASPSDD